ncbi:carbohydrate porin [Acinetobacter sp. MB5]|uniref:carbohydrate porin n=1 Tax=Acinetobacter sp. MB5 TaxID=2069438 RepID=UPI000DCFFA7A|nr:carbohydrate porin [Acinetobacter sp. MB5]
MNKNQYLAKLCLTGLLGLASSQIWAGVQTGPLNTSLTYADLALDSSENTTKHFTNINMFILDSTLNLNQVTGDDLGKIKLQVTTKGIFGNQDQDPRYRNMWMSGTGSWSAGWLASNELSDYQISQITWDKSWLNNSLDTVIGRTNPRKYFLYNYCQNFALCIDPIKGAMGAAGFNYGYWSAYGKYHVNDKLYLHSGIFEVNTDDWLNQKHGLDFSFHHGKGWLTVFGAGYKINDSSKIEAFYFNNSSKNKNALTGEVYKNTDGFNIRMNYDFVDKPFGVFANYSRITESNYPMKGTWEAGVHCYHCLFNQRISAKVGQTELHPYYTVLTERANGVDQAKNTYVSIDTNFKYKNLSVGPFVQYFFSSDNFWLSTQKPIKHNVVVGAAVTLSIF